MARMGMHDAEAQRRPARRLAVHHDGRQRCPGGSGVEIRGRILRQHLVPKVARDGHRIAAQAKRHRRYGARGERCQAQIAGDRHRCQHMRDVEMADGEPIADACPGILPGENEVDAFVGRETQFACSNQHGTVEQRQEASGYLMGRAH